ncbi:helix-turn-helix transcriptional regulator [Hoyosella altamirensis]|uniref:Proteasome accessory factor C n=1 Tax=Hoyosella altamirensis TaxID=616997 RepID=A0A839RLL2_9ACTN|nr:YafY family protein [Hoyosella altamirensis]MBB3037277.1 proteasome accessory factor C [Hoyosella altamirensis]
MTASRVSARLVRLLNLVPYLLANPGISKTELASEFGVNQRDLMRDLNLLWLCGLPGYGPGDLIDLSFEDSTVSVTFSAGMERPLRLTSPEATALLVGLRALLDQPGMVDPAAAQSAIAKIEAAAGVASKERDETAKPAVGDSDAAAAAREAVLDGRALRLRYYSASRDALTERVVDPIRTLLVDDQSYLQAWCRMAEGVRLFRFDRIDDATVLDEPAVVPEGARGEIGTGLFSDDATLPVATLRIAPEAAWFLDYYPVEHTGEPDSDGWITGSMRFASSDWMARLLVGFGSHVAVVSPPELVERVQQRAEAGLAAYANAGLAAYG